MRSTVVAKLAGDSLSTQTNRWDVWRLALRKTTRLVPCPCHWPRRHRVIAPHLDAKVKRFLYFRIPLVPPRRNLFSGPAHFHGRAQPNVTEQPQAKTGS